MSVAFAPWKRYGHDGSTRRSTTGSSGYRDVKTGLDRIEGAQLLTELVEAHFSGQELGVQAYAQSLRHLGEGRSLQITDTPGCRFRPRRMCSAAR